MDIWDRLISEAKRVQNDRVISPFIEAGGVAAAILTKKGNIYLGVCVDTACGLGACAERVAIMNMITNGEKATAIVERKGLSQISDEGAIKEIVQKIVEAHPAEVESYRNGKTNLLGFFVGQVMKETKGRANPKTVNELIRSFLEA